MIDLFESAGVRKFDITFTDTDRAAQTSSCAPAAPPVLLVQLDDLDNVKPIKASRCGCQA